MFSNVLNSPPVSPRPGVVGHRRHLRGEREPEAEVRQDVPLEDGAVVERPDRVRDAARRARGPRRLQPPAHPQPQRKVPLHHEAMLLQECLPYSDPQNVTSTVQKNTRKSTAKAQKSSLTQIHKSQDIYL